MSTDNLIAAEELAKQIKMVAEGIKKKPGLMKSTAAPKQSTERKD
jgi:hypothetical protein